jgi:hypothetical protein
LEPPARRAHFARRRIAADRSPFARALLGPGLLAVLVLSASCGGRPGGAGGSGVPEGSDLALADATAVEPGFEGTFDDLPGVEGLDALALDLQSSVVARANRTRCDCGCPNHSVNHCLHQDETCEVALRLARSFVDDALSLQLQTGDAAPAASEDQPDREPATPDGPGEPADGGSL